MTLSKMPGLRRSFKLALVIAVVLAVLPAISLLGSPPAVRAVQPATPVASPVALGLRIRDLQGSAHRTAREGQFVADVPGIVTAIRPEGFYLQDPVPDADDATSEGILVVSAFAPRGMPQIAVGDAVLVDGIAEEVYLGDPDDAPLSGTQLVPFAIAILAHDQPLPAPVVIGAAGRQPPADRVHDAVGDVETTGVFQPDRDAIDFYESLEGMLVAIPDAVVVGPQNTFGEVYVLADAGAAAQPRTSRGGIAIDPAADDFNPERILLDDEVLRSLGATLPNVDVGARFAAPLVGVTDYGFAAYRVQLTAPQAVTASGAPREVAAAGPDELVIATLNVENLAAVDPTLWEVEETAKFAGLADIIVEHLNAPDLIVLEEIQDDNGEGRDAAQVVDASGTAQRLMEAITAQGGPPYAFVDVDPAWDQDGGAPGGNIRVAFLHRTDREIAFTPRGTPTATTTVSVGGASGNPQLSTNPGRILAPNAGELAGAFADSRKPLVAEFTVGERTLFVIGNHFTARSGSGAFFGQKQPPLVRGGDKREDQATIVGEFVGQILARDADALVVVLGDFNDFAGSETLTTLAEAGGESTLTNLVAELPVEERYTYVFEGNSQALDHLLVSPALLKALVPGGFDIVHVNAEYADQASDHDPLLARFDLLEP